MTSSGIDVPAPSELGPTVPRYFQMIATMWHRTPLGKGPHRVPNCRRGEHRRVGLWVIQRRLAHCTPDASRHAERSVASIEGGQ